MTAGDRRASAATITVFKDRRRLLGFYLVFGGLIALQGIATAIYFHQSDDTEPGLRYVAIGLSLFMTYMGYWFAIYAWRRRTDPENPIIVGPAVLHDRALSERPIAWSDIRNLRVWHSGRGGPVVVFDVAAGANQRAGIRQRAQVAAIANKPFRYTHHVHAMGTDASIDRLVAAIAPYAEVKR
jgi:hypothetical protein